MGGRILRYSAASSGSFSPPEFPLFIKAGTAQPTRGRLSTVSRNPSRRCLSREGPDFDFISLLVIIICCNSRCPLGQVSGTFTFTFPERHPSLADTRCCVPLPSGVETRAPRPLSRDEMPHPLVATGAVVAVTVAVATAVAIYESPEVRRYADDVRRRVAFALHAMGDGINPAHREPRFNRPEDAEGFMESRRGVGAEDGVDADEETRRRQREELLYWNSLRLEKEKEKEKEMEEGAGQERPALTNGRRRGSSFDDFLRQDESAEQGAYVFNTGTDARGGMEGLRHRGDGSRGFSSIYANPFADENHIEAQDLDDMETSNISPTKDEISDIYSVTTRDDEKTPVTPEPVPALVDIESTPARSESASTATVDRELGPDEFMTAGQEDRHEAYASIQAWAQNSSPDFYSPLPVTPTAPISEPEVISEGQLTPTDSVSLVGSADDVANDIQSSRDGETGRYYDVMSESSGMATPASWSEVGSVISESDAPIPVRS
ncbi:hypothetical protein G7Z17_g6973 [Cylindrodendrum hubeiense]|uniref:Uncharacterized protein n=1 Tax=Cylindrodendrum hubeiense TaxID=595255 RepID=A0A9P5H980_9HYPO|nr:hypothetical protein G7Z17_g6973 [Cylindrodendrum hubeiense]